MHLIRIDQSKITQAAAQKLIAICPFGAISQDDKGNLVIGEGCRLCKQCLKADPVGALSLEVQENKAVDIDSWSGITVVAEFLGGTLHPVTLELLGKARELSGGKMPISVILIGNETAEAAKTLSRQGADEVYVYDDKALHAFEPLRFSACAEDAIRRIRPAVVMIGATIAGRSLAPRLAARFKTGLTADCTLLEMRENGELLQTRPAFGGNVMASIVTRTRPQMCTVRYRVFDAPEAACSTTGRILQMELPAFDGRIEIVSAADKNAEKDLSEADAIVAVGRGCASRKNLEDAQKLAELLGARLGCTRPMVEAGHFNVKHQIGLSGRTVKPKYIIALGISGSVQFAAGMQATDLIIAVNNDPEASIFKIAHIGYCCDAGEFLPHLIEEIEQYKAKRKGAEEK